MLCHVSDPNLERGRIAFILNEQLTQVIHETSTVSRSDDVEKRLGKPSKCCYESGKYCRRLQPVTKNVFDTIPPTPPPPLPSPSHIVLQLPVIILGGVLFFTINSGS